MHRTRRLAPLCAALALSTGCLIVPPVDDTTIGHVTNPDGSGGTGGGGWDPTKTISSFTLTGTGGLLLVGNTAKLGVSIGFTDGTTSTSTAAVSWVVDTGNVVAVSPDGTVQGIGVGVAKVSALVAGFHSTNEAQFSVDVPQVDLRCESSTVSAGAGVYCTLWGLTATGADVEALPPSTYYLTPTAPATASAELANWLVRVPADATGTVTVTATYSGAGGTQTDEVTLSIVHGATVALSATGGVLRFGETQSIGVSIDYGNGTVSTSPADATWYSSNQAAVQVVNGVVTPVGVGHAQVYASVGSAYSQPVEYDVFPALVSLRCQASTLSAGSGTYCDLWGQTAAGLDVQQLTSGWSLSTSTASVQKSDNYVWSDSSFDGTPTITATYAPGGIEPMTATASIDFVCIGTLTLSEDVGSDLVVGTTRKLTLAITRAGGGALPAGFTGWVGWSAGQYKVVNFSGSSFTGVTVTASAIGTASITATLGGVTSNALAIAVVPHHVGWSIEGVSVQAGSSVAMPDHVSYDSAGYPVLESGGFTVSYASASEAIATVSASAITGVAQGGTTVTVTVAGVTSNGLPVTVAQSAQSPVFAGLASAQWSGSGVDLGWSAATDPQGQTVTYRIYCTTAPVVDYASTPYGTDSSPTGTSTSTCGSAPMVCGTAYTLAVRAVDTEGNVDSNTVARTVQGVCDNPPVAGAVPFYDAASGHLKYVLVGSPTTVYDLGSVRLAGGGVDVTGPRFLFGTTLPRPVGIGQNDSGGQFVYSRNESGQLVMLGSVSVDTGGRGQTTPGSATAFGLTGTRSDLIAYTQSGSDTSVVDLWVMRADGSQARRILADVERAVPTSNGKVAVVYLDNVYVVTPPDLSVATDKAKLLPITLDGGHSGQLLFGRRSTGGSDTVVAFAPPSASGSVVASIYDLADSSPILPSTVTIAGMEPGMTGTFVTSTGPTAWLDGLLVLQRQVSSSESHLYTIDVEASTPTATDLTPAGGVGAATVDTAR